MPSFLRIVSIISAILCFSSNAMAERYALIIGNADYAELDDLQNTHADAQAYHSAFQELGYDATLLFDLDIDNTEIALDALLDKVAPGDDVAIVYAGHGWSDGQVNFLLPTDAPRQASDRTLRRSSIPLRDGQNGILDDLEAAGVRLTVAIIDACRNNPFDPADGTRSSSMSRGLAPMSAPPGTFVIFSAGSGQESLDRLPDDPADQTLSVFTRVFVPRLTQGMYLEDAISEAQIETNQLALQYDGHEQSPAYYDETLGKTCLSDNCDDISRGDVAAYMAALQDAELLKQFVLEFPDSELVLAAQQQITASENALTLIAAQNTGATGGDALLAELIQGCDRAAMHGSALDDNPYGAAWVYTENVDKEAALTACRAVLELDPDNQRARFLTARVQSVADNYSVALPILDQLDAEGYLPAVTYLGLFHDGTNGDETDLTEAARRYQAGCDAGIAWSCGGLAEVLRNEGYEGYDIARGVELEEFACRNGDPSNCDDAGWALENGEGGLVVDVERAEDLYLFGCAADVGNACGRAGYLYEFGKLGEADYGLASTFYLRGCALNSAWSCARMGYVNTRSDYDGRSVRAALEYGAQGCEGGQAWICDDVGYIYEKGRDGITVDFEQALAWYTRGCDLGNGNSCANVGVVYRDGGLGYSDPVQASEFYAKGCELDNARACAALADIYEDGDLGAPNLDRATEYFALACEGGNQWGCARLGGLHMRSEAPNSDPAYGLELMAASCESDAGQEWVCAEAAHYLSGIMGIDSVDLPFDPTRAAQLAETGCFAEEMSACDVLADIMLYVDFEVTSVEIERSLNTGCAMGNEYSCQQYISFAYDLMDQDMLWNAATVGCVQGRVGPMCVIYGMYQFSQEHRLAGVQNLMFSLETGDPTLLDLELSDAVDVNGAPLLSASDEVDLIKMLQSELFSLGYYNDSIDGVIGPNMRNAMGEYCGC